MDNLYKEGKSGMVTVCTIAPNFNIEDVDPELTADGNLFCFNLMPEL